jgi:hypothetical protein
MIYETFIPLAESVVVKDDNAEQVQGCRTGHGRQILFKTLDISNFNFK